MKPLSRFLMMFCVACSAFAYAADTPTPSCPGGQCAAPGGSFATGQCPAPGSNSCASGQCAAPGGSCAAGQCSQQGQECGSLFKIAELIFYDDDSGQTNPQAIMKLNNGIKLIADWEVDWFYKGQTVGVYNYSCCHLTLVTYDCHGKPERQFEFHKYPDSHVYLWP